MGNGKLRLCAGIIAACLLVVGCSGSSSDDDETNGQAARATTTSLVTDSSNRSVPRDSTAAAGTAAAGTGAPSQSGGDNGTSVATPGDGGPSGGNPTGAAGGPGASGTAAPSGNATPAPTSDDRVRSRVEDGLVFRIDAPSSASGSFKAEVHVSGARERARGFNVQIEFDPSLVRLASINYGGAIGPSDRIFCPPAQIENENGRGLLACVVLGDSVTIPTGALAIFNFERVKSGRATLAITTFEQGGANRGAYLIDDDDNPVAGKTQNHQVEL